MTGKRILWLISAAVLALVQPGWAGMMYSVDAPDTGLTGNSFVDMIYNDGYLWLASERGLSYSTDGGLTWYTRTTETNPGLSSDEPSALFGRTGQIWMAGSHFEMYDNVNYPFGDGISMSTDNGENWTKLTPPEASSFAKLVYDLAGTENATYAACFYGGLIVRHDPDTVWEHVYFSPDDSLDYTADQWPNLTTGRYYSCAVDTTHNDTLVVYGGSAHGVNKFLYLPKRVKLGGLMIYDILPVGGYIYLAGDGGVTQADSANLDQMYTADATNGLGSDWVKRLAYFGGKLWAAVFDPANNTGLGLYYLDNPESEWTAIRDNTTGPSDLWAQSNPGLFAGENGGIYDFNTSQDSVFYIAAGDSGVYRSLDSGQTWNRFYVDPLDTDQTSLRNQVYSIDVTPDSIFLGTRAGLVIAVYSEPLSFSYDTLVEFAESDTSSSWVTQVRHMDNDSASFTYVGLEPQTDTGSYSTIFLDPNVDSLDSNGTPQMRGVQILNNTRLNRIYITENTTLLAGDLGFYTSPNFPSSLNITRLNVSDVNRGLTLDSYRFLCGRFIGETVFTGSSGGYAYNAYEGDPPVLVWHITIANTDPTKHDLAVGLRSDNVRLPGNWVVALSVQDTGSSEGVLWAACRGVPRDTTNAADTVQQYNGIGFSTDYGDSWQLELANEQVWNFAFDHNGVAYAAASTGLYAAPPPWTTWQRQNIIDPVTQDTIAAETEVFSVEVTGDILWAGTELGLARKNIDPDSSWSITRTFKATESNNDVFAAPVPYSPLNNNGRLSIHYHVDQGGEVSVEIYDFSMNLVRRITENKYREGGGDYFETWDGYNGRGDMVAVGIYYIKVSYSTGETRWGRLAIIP